MWSRWLLVPMVGVQVGIDQWTKTWAVSSLGPERQVSVAPTVDFDLSYNRGFSFGTGAGQGRLVGVLVIVLIVVLGRFAWRQRMGPRLLLLTVILGGALGNLGDRVFRADDGLLTGPVVDFIDVHWYAVFNLADIFVVGGVLALFLIEVVRPLALRSVVAIDPPPESLGG